MAEPAGAAARYLFGQFGRPHGAVGRLAGWVMAHRRSNRRRNDWTVALLDLAPGHRVLEIGHGPGLALGPVLQAVGPEGRVTGLDRSALMHRAAARRHADAIEAGRLTLHEGEAEDADELAVPALAGPFDRIFSVNACLFWRDPVAVYRALAARLSPGGRLVTTLQPRLEPDADTAVRAIADQMRAAGLTVAATERLDSVSPPAVAVIAAR